MARLAYVTDEERRLGELSHLLSSSGDDAMKNCARCSTPEKARARTGVVAQQVGRLGHRRSCRYGQDVDGIKVVAARLEGLDAKSLRDSVDQLKQQLGDCVVLLAGAADGRVSLIAGVHGKALGRIKAGSVVAHVAAQIDGKGGGRPTWRKAAVRIHPSCLHSWRHCRWISRLSRSELNGACIALFVIVQTHCAGGRARLVSTQCVRCRGNGGHQS
jgi:alanyl-tRNA synthetase